MHKTSSQSQILLQFWAIVNCVQAVLIFKLECIWLLKKKSVLSFKILKSLMNFFQSFQFLKPRSSNENVRKFSAPDSMRKTFTAESSVHTLSIQRLLWFLRLSTGIYFERYWVKHIFHELLKILCEKVFRKAFVLLIDSWLLCAFSLLLSI